MKMFRLFPSFSAVFWLLSAAAHAEDSSAQTVTRSVVAVPNQFSTGEIIDAERFNQNFSALSGEISNLRDLISQGSNTSEEGAPNGTVVEVVDRVASLEARLAALTAPENTSPPLWSVAGTFEWDVVYVPGQPSVGALKECALPNSSPVLIRGVARISAIAGVCSACENIALISETCGTYGYDQRILSESRVRNTAALTQGADGSRSPTLAFSFPRFEDVVVCFAESDFVQRCIESVDPSAIVARLVVEQRLSIKQRDTELIDTLGGERILGTIFENISWAQISDVRDIPVSVLIGSPPSSEMLRFPEGAMVRLVNNSQVFGLSCGSMTDNGHEVLCTGGFYMEGERPSIVVAQE